MNVKALRDAAMTAAVIGALAFPAAAQDAPAPLEPQQSQDQVSQLAEVVGLSEDQEAEIRATIDQYQPQIETLQEKTQQAQLELREKAGPDFDEEEIRDSAEQYGDLAGELLALNVIMQSSIESVFTEEQRQKLEARIQQEQEQQRRQQRQLQEQLEQRFNEQDRGNQ